MSTLATELAAEQAEIVLATLANTSAGTLYAFAEGVVQADPPASRFSLATFYAATCRERGEPPDALARLEMRSAIRDCATRKDDAFIDRLEGARSPFWQAVRDALVALR